MLHAVNNAVVDQKTAVGSTISPSTKVERLNILLVEDMHSDAVLTTLALEATSTPFRLTRVKCGDDALSRLLLDRRCCPQESPDLILLDLGLPGMNGFEVLAEIARMSPAVRAIPIVILTAQVDFEYIRHSYPLCVIDYVNKPCLPEDMERLLLEVKRCKAKIK